MNSAKSGPFVNKKRAFYLKLLLRFGILRESPWCGACGPYAPSIFSSSKLNQVFQWWIWQCRKHCACEGRQVDDLTCPWEDRAVNTPVSFLFTVEARRVPVAGLGLRSLLHSVQAGCIWSKVLEELRSLLCSWFPYPMMELSEPWVPPWKLALKSYFFQIIFSL